MLEGDFSMNEGFDGDDGNANKAIDLTERKCDVVNLGEGEKEEDNEKKRSKTSSVWLEFE